MIAIYFFRNHAQVFVKMESTFFDSTMKLVKVNVPDEQAMIDVTANKIVEYAVTNKQAVMFVPSTELAEKLYRAIKELEHFDTAIAHAGLEQKHRETLLDLYYKGFFQILITTDVNYLYEGIDPFKVCSIIQSYSNPYLNINTTLPLFYLFL